MSADESAYDNALKKQRRSKEEARKRKRFERDTLPIHYVYLLLNNEQPFYVGSSRSNHRLMSHIGDAKANQQRSGIAKNVVIRGILADGRTPELRKIANGLTLKEARDRELEIIYKMGTIYSGLGPLTNKIGGGIEAEYIPLEDGDTFNPKTTPPHDMARAIFGQLQPYRGKFKAFVTECRKLLKEQK
jgi:hypothetical protein